MRGMTNSKETYKLVAFLKGNLISESRWYKHWNTMLVAASDIISVLIFWIFSHPSYCQNSSNLDSALEMDTFS
jgi:hypothetical protein